MLSVAMMLPKFVFADSDREIGEDAFNRSCSGCHGAQPVARAPSREQLAAMPPEKIFQTQTSGIMLLQASALNDLEKWAVALYLSEIEWGTVAEDKAAEELVRCDSSTPITAADFEGPTWVGWGLDAEHTHFQPAAKAGLGADDLANLELKWAFGHAGGTTITTQPAVVGQRIFIGSPTGAIYALDAKTGCAYWK